MDMSEVPKQQLILEGAAQEIESEKTGGKNVSKNEKKRADFTDGTKKDARYFGEAYRD